MEHGMYDYMLEAICRSEDRPVRAYQNLPLIRERRIEMIAKTNSICTSSPNEKRKNPNNHPITRITAIT
jgi:hypothetical protein